jgi:hypothetical protein
MRPLAQILATVTLGFALGALITISIHGYEPTLRIAHALLYYVWSDYSLAP